MEAVGHRRQRIDAQLHQELALALAGDAQDPRLGWVTVVGVSCDPDLSYARVRVSVLGDEAQRQDALRALRGMRGFLRHRLGERLEHLRRVPRLDFLLDDSAAQGVRLGGLLDELSRSEGGGGG